MNFFKFQVKLMISLVSRKSSLALRYHLQVSRKIFKKVESRFSLLHRTHNIAHKVLSTFQFINAKIC